MFTHFSQLTLCVNDREIKLPRATIWVLKDLDLDLCVFFFITLRVPFLVAKPLCALALSCIIKATAADGTQQSMGAMWPNIAVHQASCQSLLTTHKLPGRKLKCV